MNASLGEAQVLENEWRHMDCQLDEGPARRGAIGLVTLANDVVIESELRTFAPLDGVAVFANRIAMDAVVTVDSLRAMADDLPRTVAGLVPYSPLDVIAFGCTSGTMAIGADSIRDKILEARPGVATSDPISASLAALGAVGARRIALLTPYVDEVNAVVERYVSERGFEIVAKGSFKQCGDPEIVRVPPDAIHAAALSLGRHAAVDAVFISCTGLRTSPIIDSLEAALGKPVVASNQALAWDCLRQCGCNEPVMGFGRLLASARA